MGQQHDLRVVDNDREDLCTMAQGATKRRRTVRARVFKSNIHDSWAPPLDLDDIFQRRAQASHIGKTIDDIP